MSTLLRRREVAVWGVCLVAVWALLVATGFVSRDPDSAFYAVMTERLANGPASALIAPEWGGLWNGTGLWQEHPIGIYLVPIAFAKLGFPAGQAAYAVGIAAALGCLVLMARLAAAGGTPRLRPARGATAISGWPPRAPREAARSDPRRGRAT